MDDADYQEWLFDFGGTLTRADLDRMLARSRQVSEVDMRRLVKTHLMLRHYVRDFLLPVVEGSAVPLTESQRSAIERIRNMVQDFDSDRDA